MEVNSAVILLIGLLALQFFGPKLSSDLAAFTRFTLHEAGHIHLTVENIGEYTRQGLLAIGALLFPTIAALAVAGAAANLAQVGFFTTAEPLTPNLEKIDPVAGFKRLFSSRSLVNFGLTLAKIGVISLVCFVALRGLLDQVVALADQSVGAIAAWIIGNAFSISLKVCLVLVVIAVLDYGYQRWEYERGLRMTKQEIKEELRHYEGDPLVRSRIRSIQKQMAMRRMMASVPKADVVITNPTHLAVAVQYDPKKMGAPTVVAKGARLIAERIRRIAVENDIPIVENKPLAQALYKGVQVGREIPQEFYRALAEVLVYVYRLGKRSLVRSAS